MASQGAFSTLISVKIIELRPVAKADLAVHSIVLHSDSQLPSCALFTTETRALDLKKFKYLLKNLMDK